MWQASNAAFTATTTNGAQSFSTGSVAISDNDGGSGVLFTVSGLKPGSTGTACITVSYTGSLAAGVRLYGTSPSTTNSLSSYVLLQIDETTGSGTITYPSCTGFGASTTLFNSTLASFGSAKTSYATGLSSWNPGGSATRDYRFTYTLDSAAPNTTMSSSAAITFVWEAQNT